MILGIHKIQNCRIMGKPVFCICENKGADQLRGNRASDQRLCFRYIDITIPQLSKIRNSMPLSLLCGHTVRFLSDLFGNPEDRFSHDAAKIQITEGQSRAVVRNYCCLNLVMVFSLKFRTYLSTPFAIIFGRWGYAWQFGYGFQN